MSTCLLIERNVPVSMRDGVILRADVYRPDSPTPLPAILSRFNWGKSGVAAGGIDAVQAVEAGFAVVFQDTRGRFQSEGEYYLARYEGQDGYDTVEWVSAQRWCSSAVGMTGGSYGGMTQWVAAQEQPPHLKAIFPFVSPSEPYEGTLYQGGAFQLGWVLLVALLQAPDTATRLARAGLADPEAATALLLALDKLDDQYRHLPLCTQPMLYHSKVTPFYFDFLSHSSNDGYWQPIGFNRGYKQVLVPAYHVGGWYDLFLHGTLENFTRMCQEGGSELARRGQRLLVGPWLHGASVGDFTDYRFGVTSAADFNGAQIRYFSHYLKGEDNGIDREPPVRIFVMGENQWRDEQEWPLARTHYTAWYLQSTGNAGTAGGSLSPEALGAEPDDAYLYDPRNPAPTVGGPTVLQAGTPGSPGPKDQRGVEARPDVLVYTSEPMQQPLEVTGPLTVTLYAASSAPDTDFVAKLCDVHPDGASRILAEGILRARFREGTQQEHLIEPGRVYQYVIDLVATSNVFLPGHRIRLDVTSSSFPRFDRNPNTGHPLGQDGYADLRPALQRIYHDGEHPSHILLPIIPR